MTGDFRRASMGVTQLQQQLETMKLLMATGLVSRGKGATAISSITAELTAATVAAEAFHTRMLAIQGGLLKGGLLLGAAMIGGKMLKATLGPGNEYLKRQAQMALTVTDKKELKQLTNAAWAASGDVGTTTASDALAAVLDLRNVMLTPQDAIKVLPVALKSEAIFRAAGMDSSQARGQTFEAAKVIDLLGRGQSPESYEKHLGYMTRVSMATGGRITPESYRMNLKYAREAAYSLDDGFIYGVMPSLMMAVLGKAGGSGAHGGIGTSIRALNKGLNQGVMNKVAHSNLVELGLMARGPSTKTTTLDTQAKKGVIDSELAGRNPYLWFQKYLVPALIKQNGRAEMSDPKKLAAAVTKTFSGMPGTFISAAVQLAVKDKLIMRDYEVLEGTASLSEAFEYSKRHNPSTMYEAFFAQWEDLKIQIGKVLLPPLLWILPKITAAVSVVVWAMHEFPAAAYLVTAGFVALTLALTALGATAIFLVLAKLGVFTVMMQGLSTVFGVILGNLSIFATTLGVLGAAFLSLPVSWIVAICAGIVGLGVALWNFWDIIGWMKGKAVSWGLMSASSGPASGGEMFPKGMNPVIVPTGGYTPEIRLRGDFRVDGDKLGQLVMRRAGQREEQNPLGSFAYDPLQGYVSGGIGTSP